MSGFGLKKAFVLSIGVVLLAAAFSHASTIERVSTDDGGNDADNKSEEVSISGDGSKIAFSSFAGNLVVGDNNGVRDIFVYDRNTSSIRRVSVDNDGNESNGASDRPGISRNGNFVAFSSASDILVGDDLNGVKDIFVYDLVNSTIERVSLNDAGEEGNGNSNVPGLSADGRYVAFISAATNFGNSAGDVYVYDRDTDTIELVCKNNDGFGGNGPSFTPFISGSGRFVIFGSYSSNLVDNDNNGAADIFVFDRQAQTIERVSVSSAGQEGNAYSWNFPTISDDGRYAAFTSYASNLAVDDQASTLDAFLRDRQAQTTQMISKNDAPATHYAKNNASISADGNYVAFDVSDFSFAPGDTNSKWDVVLWDRQADVYSVASLDEGGSAGGGQYPVISADGGCVAFETISSLVAADTNSWIDIYASCGVMIVPTVTPTGTVTETATESVSFTETPTYTFTPTVTETATESVSFTETSTYTFTPTVTDTPIASSTFTVSLTPTVSSTFTGSVTGTETFTPTASVTVSLTESPSGTFTYSVTATATPTVSATATPSVSSTTSLTVTATPSVSSTTSFTVTATATVSASASYTGTHSVTNTKSRTPTLTRTLTVSASPTYTDTGTFTTTATDTFVSTATFTVSATATDTFTSTVTFTATATETFTVSATASSTVSLTVTATQTVTPTVTSSATVTPTFTVTNITTRSLTKTMSVTCTPTFTPTPPAQRILAQAFYPNPWNGNGDAFIAFSLAAPAEKVVIKLFTVSNRQIYEEVVGATGYGGYVKVRFTGRDGKGNVLTNGVYFYVIEVYTRNGIKERGFGKVVVLR